MAKVYESIESEINAADPQKMLNQFTDFIQKAMEALNGFQAHGVKNIRLSFQSYNSSQHLFKLEGDLDVKI